MSAMGDTPTRQPWEVVDHFLQLWEDGEDERAAELLAPEPLIVFPGSPPMHSLQEVRNSRHRQYRWVRKHRDHYATAELPDASVQVTSRGRLHGENLHGVEFQDIRYVDIFVVRAGLIAEQHVWNDLCVTGVLDAG
jgi:ketosteroid isomerase-like protein